MPAKQRKTKSRASCFRRATRRIRRALSRICRGNAETNDVGYCYIGSMPSSMPSRGRPMKHSIKDCGQMSHSFKPASSADNLLRGELAFEILPVYDSSDGYHTETDREKYPFTLKNEDNLCLQINSMIFLDEELVKTEVMGGHMKTSHRKARGPGTEPPTFFVQDTSTHQYAAVLSRQVSRCLQTSSSDPSLSGPHSGSCLPRSDRAASLSQFTSAQIKTFTRSESLPNMTLQTSFEDFTPDVLDQENEESDESYSFRCCRPGLYRCRVTGLLFLMDGEGEVVYRTVPWDRRLLAQYGKKPAGPLFDITCVQQSVCQLHLPHCEISSTGGRRFLWVAHVNHDGLEIIRPHQTTETHVIINISGFSGYGNIKDEDSPAVPIRAMVLLFYRPSADPDEESVVSVLMLPKNVPLLDVRRTRKKLVGEENYIETHSQCKLLPYQEYTLSSFPQDNTVLVQPPSAEFDSENYDNFIPSFQVILETLKKHIKLTLTDSDSSHAVWQTRVCFPSSGLKKPCWLSPLNLPSDRTLLDIRTSFIDGVSEPVLKSLLDHLLQKEVIADCEMGSMKGIWDHFDKARSVIDLVRNKGEAASSIMIEFLCKKDPFFSEHLGLI